ncbi:MAG: DNA primase [Candidatus Nomurabacteria bacterium]|jgi:DNA primase|nr:DNA primase [Candidatus Nomurabacteria bacterium]
MNDAKEEIRARLAIEDIVGEYVQLRRSGRLWRGLSPFTNEKTPSFFVTPEKNIWHDFSANKGGDVYAFIMEMEGVDFRGALELLARKAGVDLTQYDTRVSKSNNDKKHRILEMNNIAKNYFQQNLVHSKPALEYVKQRHLNKGTIMEWGIGYAPESPTLKNLLEKKTYKIEEIRSAGLIGGRGGAMFRSRLIIPLSDTQGQVVGFTGRIIGDGEPKYLNTPQTLLYDKGRQVFGLHLAKKSIREHDKVIVVEGNLDVISSHQAGVKHVVAAAGTALTRDHLKSLSRLTQNISLCFDADKAGIAATERAIPMAQELNLVLSIITIDGAKDPDELIQQSPQKWQNIIENPKPAIQWLIDVYSGRVDMTSAEGKKKLTTEALTLLKKISDPVECEHYLKVLSDLTGASMTALTAKLEGKSSLDSPRLKQNKAEKVSTHRRDEKVYLNYIFAASLKWPKYAGLLANIPDRYLDQELYKIRWFILEDYKEALAEDEATRRLAEIELIADQLFANKQSDRDELMDYYRNLELVNYETDLKSLRRQFSTVESSEKTRLLNETINSYNKIVANLKSTGVTDGFQKLQDLWSTREN